MKSTCRVPRPAFTWRHLLTWRVSAASTMLTAGPWAVMQLPTMPTLQEGSGKLVLNLPVLMHRVEVVSGFVWRLAINRRLNLFMRVLYLSGKWWCCKFIQRERGCEPIFETEKVSPVWSALYWIEDLCTLLLHIMCPFPQALFRDKLYSTVL